MTRNAIVKLQARQALTTKLRTSKWALYLIQLLELFHRSVHEAASWSTNFVDGSQSI